MSSDFEGYEQDFAVLTAEITNKIARVPRLPPGENPILAGWGWPAEPGGLGDGTPSEQVYLRREAAVSWCWGPPGGMELELVEGKGTVQPGCREKSPSGLQSGLRHLVTCIILGMFL